MEGWLAVTVSGLVSVALLKPGGALLTASESLCRLRGRVALADIAFTGGGNIVVAASDGSSSSPVQFYKVRASPAPGPAPDPGPAPARLPHSTHGFCVSRWL